MKHLKRIPLREVGKRKKIFLFVGLCIVTFLILILTVVFVSVIKSDSDDDGKEIKIIRIFTNLNKTGGNGPIGINPYKGTTLQREVVLVDGIQIWKVPFQGIWYFEVYGAAGGYGLHVGHNRRLRGGFGTKVAGSLKLREGEVLKILVGQEGQRDQLAEFRSGSGGGGTFVVSQDDNPLMVAGGGGGGGVPFLDKYHERPGGPGMAEYIGDRGKGGRLYDPKNNITVKILRYGHQCIAGAGGGFHEDGAGYLKGWGGKAFLHGGMGGKIRKRQFSALHGMSDKSGADGGFGGGGASSLLPGGGGGFFGGDVRGAYMYKKWAIHAVGGSSYNVAIYPIITSGVHKKHGRVFVMFLGKEAIPFSGNYTEDLRVPKTFEKWYENS